MTLSPAHLLVLRWLVAHPGQSAEEMAAALSYPEDAEEIRRLCHDLEARGLIMAARGWPRRIGTARGAVRRGSSRPSVVAPLRCVSRPA